jgi:hypothetical protein
VVVSELAQHAPELAAQLAALIEANRALWRLEDRVRDTSDLREKGRLKIEIDLANLNRHAKVTAIDAEVRRLWPRGADPTAPGAHATSESIGQMFDRASILTLKLSLITDAERHAGLERRWAHLVGCIDRAMHAVRAGCFVHHEVGEVKAYGTGSGTAG